MFSIRIASRIQLKWRNLATFGSQCRILYEDVFDESVIEDLCCPCVRHVGLQLQSDKMATKSVK